MLKDMGLKNGTAFFQALPYNGKIYFHEMGYRLSGGMLFKFTDPMLGINDMKMMIRLALGEEICSDEALQSIDVTANKKIGAQLTVPLWEGTIASVEGLEELKKIPCLLDFIQYYKVGDTVRPEHIGTLGQHFGRFSMIADTHEEIVAAVERISKELVIKDENGKVMNLFHFDMDRTK